MDIVSSSPVNGDEVLTLKVAWVNGHRDRIVIEHTPVGAATPVVVVSGRSGNDAMRAIARFFD